MKKKLIGSIILLTISSGQCLEPRRLNSALELPTGTSFEYRGKEVTLMHSNMGWEIDDDNNIYHIKRDKNYIENAQKNYAKENDFLSQFERGRKVVPDYSADESVRIIKNKKGKIKSIVSNRGDILTILEINKGRINSTTKCKERFPQAFSNSSKFSNCITVTKMMCDEIKSSFEGLSFDMISSKIISCDKSVKDASKKLFNLVHKDSDGLNNAQEAEERNEDIVDRFKDIEIANHSSTKVAKQLGNFASNPSPGKELLQGIDQCQYLDNFSLKESGNIKTIEKKIIKNE